ncbi:sulfatase [bacterium]|nr:sulfatase [bacterium]MCI0607004.1 sulfatase [bacterium]
MKKLDVLLLAVWSGFICGVLESVIHVVTRNYPAVLAAEKVSLDVLWAAPLLNIVCFSLLAVPLLLFRNSRWIAAIFSFVCFTVVLITPQVLHWISVLLLSLGLAVTVHRAMRNRIEAVHKLLWVIPLFLGAAWGFVQCYKIFGESRLARSLPPVPSQAANVLVIVLDTVRYDRMKAESMLTPHLNSIANEGIRYENAWSTTSWSLPSQASILTGVYPHQHGADWPQLKIREEIPVLAEYFSQKGYVTGAFSGNASWVTPEYLGRGFLRFETYLVVDVIRRTTIGRNMEKISKRLGYYLPKHGNLAPNIRAQFFDFLNTYPQRPFFVYICYMDANKAFFSSKLTSPMAQAVAKYDQAIAELDQEVGTLIDTLREKKLLDNTILVVTSDHGESFGARTPQDHDPEGHGTSLYVEQTRVPLIVRFPKKITSGQISQQPTSIYSIPFLILQLLELRDGSFAERSNDSILATLRYDERNVASVIGKNTHYIHNIGRNREELYDLRADPFEKKNLAGSSDLTLPRNELRRLMR